MSKEFFYFLTLIAGFGVTVQAGVNSQLNLVTQNPVVTALISFLTGTIALLGYVIVTSPGSLLQPGILLQGEWWKYTGGYSGHFL